MFTSRLCIALTVLLPLVLVTAQPPKPCDCTDLEVLQLELRNAQRLRQAFREKIPELRKMPDDASVGELKRFAENQAPSVVENVPNYKGPKAVNFEPRGFTSSHPGRLPSTETDESFCRPTAAYVAALQQAIRASACEGIGKAIQAHEASLAACRSRCRRKSVLRPMD